LTRLPASSRNLKVIDPFISTIDFVVSVGAGRSARKTRVSGE